MKKTKLLTSLALASVTVSPVILATSCSKTVPYAKLRKELYSQVLEEFKELCKYPRRSNYTKPVFDYLKTKITAMGYEVHNDEYDSGTDLANGNLWFDVPATAGLENKPMMSLQAHMDMVLAAVDDATMERAIENGIEPEETTVNGRPAITSKDRQTSLGADDGIGLSIVLAIAKNKNVPHGPLRMIITTDEEGTTAGALNFGKGVEGGAAGILEPVKALLNVDDEIDHELTISSAGNSTTTINLNNLKTTTETSSSTYVMEISGLKGGHSGDCINMGRHNANKVVAEIFKDLNDDTFQLVSYTNPGLTAPNSIPSTAKVVFNTVLKKTDISSCIEKEITKIKSECEADKDVKIDLSLSYSSAKALTHEATNQFFELVTDLKHGVIEMSKTEEGLVAWSQNLGVINLQADSGFGSILLMTRAKTAEQIHETEAQNKEIAKKYFSDSEAEYTAATHGWTAADDDLMTKLVSESHHQQGVTTTLLKCHAGIECAEFAQFKPSLHLGCIGPMIDDAHSVNETVYLDTLDHLIWTILYVLDHIE